MVKFAYKAKKGRNIIMNELDKTIINENFHIKKILSVETLSFPYLKNIRSFQYNYDILLYHKNDTSVYVFGEKEYTAKEGDIVFIPRNTPYTRRLLQDHVDVICVDFLFDLPEGTSLFPKLFHKIPNADSLFKKLYKTWSVRTPGSDIGALGYLYSIYSAIIAHQSSAYFSRKHLTLLEEAQKLLSENYTNPKFSLKEFLIKSDISEVHFRKLFKAFYGMPPNQYLISLRLNEAKKLLENDIAPINKIAEMLGFSNNCYFSRLFKEKMGFSPNEYRDFFKR